MKQQIIYLSLGILLGFFIPSPWMGDQPHPWKPVLEKTDFQHLDSSVEEIIKTMQILKGELGHGHKKQSKAQLHHAMDLVLILKDYYLPVTEARQLIYDADRLLFLNQPRDAKHKLIQASKRLTGIEDSNENHAIKEPISKLDNLIREAILAIDAPRNQSFAKLETAGTEANLMLIKGELVLSGLQDREAREK